MTRYDVILARRYEGTQWTQNGEQYGGIVWLDSTPKPSKAKLDALWSDVQAEIEAERQERITARETALGKLSALGLSEAEIKALLG